MSALDTVPKAVEVAKVHRPGGSPGLSECSLSSSGLPGPPIVRAGSGGGAGAETEEGVLTRGLDASIEIDGMIIEEPGPASLRRRRSAACRSDRPGAARRRSRLSGDDER